MRLLRSRRPDHVYSLNYVFTQTYDFLQQPAKLVVLGLVLCASQILGHDA
jgi:hypothetical protein